MRAVVPLERDLRLDLFRGLSLWLLFLDQLPSAVVSSFACHNDAAIAALEKTTRRKATLRMNNGAEPNNDRFMPASDGPILTPSRSDRVSTTPA